jgi:hypothetical protein
MTDVPKVNVSSATAAFLWKNGAWDFWARGSAIRRVLGAGLTYRADKNLSHSTELIYDLNANTKGIMGMPLFWRYGFGLKTKNV